jgi:hypothetical protein
MKINEIFMYALGALIVIGFFTVLVGLLQFEVPDGNKDALYLALGSLFSAFAGVVGYFYGSSAGSKRKTDLMAGKQNEL